MYTFALGYLSVEKVEHCRRNGCRIKCISSKEILRESLRKGSLSVGPATCPVPPRGESPTRFLPTYCHVQWLGYICYEGARVEATGRQSWFFFFFPYCIWKKSIYVCVYFPNQDRLPVRGARSGCRRHAGCYCCHESRQSQVKKNDNCR